MGVAGWPGVRGCVRPVFCEVLWLWAVHTLRGQVCGKETQAAACKADMRDVGLRYTRPGWAETQEGCGGITGHTGNRCGMARCVRPEPRGDPHAKYERMDEI